MLPAPRRGPRSNRWSPFEVEGYGRAARTCREASPDRSNYHPGMEQIEPIVEPVAEAEAVAIPESAPYAPAPRLTVALTFDNDAISDSIRRGDPPVKVSHGEFGPRVAVPRILEVLEREAIG